MKISNMTGLEEKLAHSEDAELLGERHYALDLYDGEPALTLEIDFSDKGAEVTAAALLKYSEELKGYYMDERVTDAKIVSDALNNWLNSSEN